MRAETADRDASAPSGPDTASDPGAVSEPVRPGRLAWRGPRLRDPRLHVAAVLLTVQVLGQVAIRWELSIAQILVALGTAAAFEIGRGIVVDRTVAWPASGMLTGNGVALLLRVPGTKAGDWWSLNGWYLFAGTVLVSLLLKYAIRFRGRPVFNPSNIGMVIVFILFGSRIVNPQDLWWGPATVGLVTAYLVIVAGGTTLLVRLDIWRVTVSFAAVFAAGVAVLAVAGHAITARWYLGAIEGAEYWRILVLSPEILIFAFFMITDPRTIPPQRRHHVLFGSTVALLDVLLIATQQTEFGTKVAILGGLVVACACVPAIERWGGAQMLMRRWTGVAGVSMSLVAALVLSFGFRLPGSVGESVKSSYSGTMPTIALSDDLALVADAPTADEARLIVGQTLESLSAESEALRVGDADALAVAVRGPRLEASRALLVADRRYERSYTVASATITVFRTESGPQAIPTLAVRARGSVTEGPPDSQQTSDLDALFVLSADRGRWHVFDEKP